MSQKVPLTPVLLLRAYANGIFPMASSRRGGDVHWFAPDPRAVIEFADFVPGRHFRRLMRVHPYEVRINSAFRRVIEACAAPRRHDRETWISPELIDVYTRLHEMGFAHSVEAWHEGTFAGGLYCVQIGAAVMGESMVSLQPDASKVCLLTLMQRMRERGFELLDTQYITPHLRRFGAVEISRKEYERRLKAAISTEPREAFDAAPLRIPPPQCEAAPPEPQTARSDQETPTKSPWQTAEPDA